MCSPSASLAVWTSSWVSGSASPDDVVDAVTAWAPLNPVAAGDQVTASRTGLPWPSPSETGVTELLRTVREAAAGAATIRLLLPAPGDVRGLPVGTQFATAAVTAGQGVLIGTPGETGTGLVPVRESQDVLHWTVFSVPVPDYVPDTSLRETEYLMRETVRDAALALTRQQTVEVGHGPQDPRSVVASRLESAHRHRYPPMSDRVTRILDTADRVAAILDVAAGDSPVEGTTATATAAREEALRPLRASVRDARVVAYTSAIDELLSARLA